MATLLPIPTRKSNMRFLHAAASAALLLVSQVTPAVAANTSVSDFGAVQITASGDPKGFPGTSFDLITDGAPRIDLRVTGDWTISFSTPEGMAPADIHFGFFPELFVFFESPGGTDGVTGIPLGFQTWVDLNDFAGTETISVPVDFTMEMTGSDRRNVTGAWPGYDTTFGQGAALLEGPVASFYVSPSARAVFESGVINNLTLTLTAAPEPSEAVLLLAGFVALGLVVRRKSKFIGQ